MRVTESGSNGSPTVGPPHARSPVDPGNVASDGAGAAISAAAAVNANHMVFRARPDNRPPP